MKLISWASVAGELGVKLTLLLPAALGGLLALYFYEKGPEADACNWCRKAMVVAIGLGIGLYGGPAVVDGFGLNDSKGRLEMGFAVLVPVLVLAVVANVLKGIRSTDWGKAIESWVTRR